MRTLQAVCHVRRILQQATQASLPCILALLLAGCGTSQSSPLLEWLRTSLDDLDQDGYVDCNALPEGSSNCDCNDLNEEINPEGKDETCNQVDEDCKDGADPESLDKIWYPDRDGDGYALDRAEGTVTCNGPPAGDFRYATTKGDCDDNNAERYLGHEEICDGVDNDCDEAIDNGLTTTKVYADRDSDDYGDEHTLVELCVGQLPEGHVYLKGDCNDDDPAIYPYAAEICNTIDDDCDDLTDAEDGLPTYFVYPDADSDTYLNRSELIISCDYALFSSQALSPKESDCDDHDAAVHPGQDELDECSDERDLNCDGTDPKGDADLDGFTVCDVASPDCAATNGNIYPGAAEQCDGKDNDCNGLIDDLDISLVLYPDGDNDGFGDGGENGETALRLSVCTALPTHYVLEAGDCDDGDPARSPGLIESCDGVDNDCDQVIDNGLPLEEWYLDEDGDGFGVNDISVSACVAPAGYASFSDDCDDTLPAVHPYAAEDCLSTADLNCDGKTEANVDTDGDGFFTCTKDCNDEDETIHPGALETCNGLDDDCDLYIDNAGTANWHLDEDYDGYPASSSYTVLPGCNNPGWTLTNSPIDCDDADRDLNPGESEICDGKDNNCFPEDDDIACAVNPSTEVER